MRLLLPLLLPLLLFVLLARVAAGAPDGGETSVEACKRLAYNSYEDFRSTGVLLEDIKVEQALPICRATHKDDPGSVPTTYRLGRVLEAAGDYEESNQFYREAAVAGYAMAQVSYARSLSLGRGIAQNLTASFEWNKRAADQNHRAGLFDTALSYRDGLGVAPDLDKAIELAEAAARLGEAEAELVLGAIYGDPALGRLDLVAAVEHYRTSISLGSVLAEFYYGQLLQCDCALRDPAAAAALFKSASNKGLVIATRFLSAAYSNGDGVARDDVEALRLFRDAAGRGDPVSAYNIGIFYRDSRGGVAQDDEATEKWWRRAAQAGMARAQHELGRLYLFEPGPFGRRADGILWLERAAAAGEAQAYWDLFSYFTSIPVNDLDRAYEYGFSASYSFDPKLAEQGRSMMETVLRLKQQRGLEPKPPAADSGRG